MTKMLIDRAVVEQALHVAMVAEHPVKLIAALRAALAEPVQEPVQEPVAWMVYTLDGKSVCVTDNPADFTEQHKALPLYTSDPIYTMLCDLKQKGNSNERS